ncbi:hypothetical protein KSP39_PZI022091 [Platanthera zijinensis]|uniref:Uncharacterized protein n=1 Tax=Platanthera zijinensis TaxID=2320716 RepID=A0AAP0FWD7_9ASPA
MAVADLSFRPSPCSRRRWRWPTSLFRPSPCSRRRREEGAERSSALLEAAWTEGRREVELWLGLAGGGHGRERKAEERMASGSSWPVDEREEEGGVGRPAPGGRLWGRRRRSGGRWSRPR